MRTGARYAIKCQLNNTSNERLAVYFAGAFGGDVNNWPAFSLNGNPVENILQLQPGINTFIVANARLLTMYDEYNQGSAMTFTNYDNDNAFMIENCTGVMQ